ncbi:hypothetical protein NMY22_g3117 [Coprinellus aureogranulatus]|nr:hypothetical protein NMY22_g3117 [Coprinellus aureogranulatus]
MVVERRYPTRKITVFNLTLAPGSHGYVRVVKQIDITKEPMIIHTVSPDRRARRLQRRKVIDLTVPIMIDLTLPPPTIDLT